MLFGLGLGIQQSQGLAAYSASPLTSRKIGIIGDSRFATAGETPVVSPWTQLADGPICWMIAATGGRIYLPKGANTAKGGQNTTDVINRTLSLDASYDVVLPQNVAADAFIFELGRNNWSSGGTGPIAYPSPTQSQVDTIINTFAGTSKSIILTNGLPETALVTSVQNERISYRDWLAAAQRRVDHSNIIAQIDTFTGMWDSATIFDYKSGYSTDNTHLTALGAYNYGINYANLFSSSGLIRNLTPMSTMPTSASDAYNAGTNPNGVHSTSFLMTGTTGTKSGTNAANVMGNLPDNWNVIHSAGATVSCDVTSYTDTDGMTVWQFHIYGTKSTAGTGTITMRRVNSVASPSTTPYVAGDSMVHGAMCRVTGTPSNLYGLNVGLSFQGTGVTTASGLAFSSVTGTSGTMNAFPWMSVFSPVIYVPSDWATGTSTSFTNSFAFSFPGSSVAFDFTVEIKQSHVRKVV